MPPQLLLDLMSPSALLGACGASSGAAAEGSGARSGRPQARHSVQVSADIARALMASLRTRGAASSMAIGGVGGDASHCSDSGSGCSTPEPAAVQNRAARIAAPAHTPGAACAPACGGGAVSGAARPALMPAELLGGAAGVWSVGDAPESALSQEDLQAVVLKVGKEGAGCRWGRGDAGNSAAAAGARL